MIKQFSDGLVSHRFKIFILGLVIGCVSAGLRTIVPAFPLEFLYYFILPLCLGAYGLKTIEDIKKNGMVPKGD